MYAVSFFSPRNVPSRDSPDPWQNQSILHSTCTIWHVTNERWNPGSSVYPRDVSHSPYYYEPSAAAKLTSVTNRLDTAGTEQFSKVHLSQSLSSVHFRPNTKPHPPLPAHVRSCQHCQFLSTPLPDVTPNAPFRPELPSPPIPPTRSNPSIP